MGVDVYVFNNKFALLGMVNIITGLSWNETFADAGSFELWCALTDQNISILQKDNLVWIKGDSAGVIEIRELSVDDSGIETLHIQGRLAECYLSYRTVYPAVSKSGKVSTVLREMVEKNITSPTDSDRKISCIELATDQVEYGESISYQQTGETVLKTLTDLCGIYSLGFRLQFLPKEQKFVFRVYQGTNRSINQSSVIPVVFSTDLDEILDSSYVYNQTDYCNFAYSAGEDSGSNRKVVTIGSASGLERRELFVDARDIQSEKEDGTTISATEYNDMLKERGNSKLEEHKVVQEFSANVRTFGNTGYIYGTDYFLGDTVTVYDRRLKVQLDAQVTSVTTSYDEEGEHLEVTFGYGQPTIADKLRRLQ